MATNELPHNIDAEAALLGCIIIDGDIQTEVIESLKEEDFYQKSHRDILRAMRAVFEGKKTVDVVTLTDELDREGTLDSVGGLQYITELAQITPSAANYKQYLQIVKRDAINRALIRAAKSIIENSMPSPEERDAISYAEKLVYDIAKKEDKNELADLDHDDTLQQILKKFETIQTDPNAFRGVETGFRHLDRITNGLQKSDLIVLAARPGVGKTSFAMNIIEHASMQRGKVSAVFSLEMPRIQIEQRLLCSYANVSMEKALSGKLNQKEWKALMLASDKLRKGKIYIDDSSHISPAEILSKCRRLKSAIGALDIVMVDYIQLMGGESKFGKDGRGVTVENRQQEIASITRDLKIMAKELNVPVLALSQLRRIQTNVPQLSDLRESGAIEQDADIVMFIDRPETRVKVGNKADENTVKGAAELIIAKHRNGKCENIQLRFIGESTKFVDVDAQGRPDEPPEYGAKKPAWEEQEGQGAEEDKSGLPFD